MSEPEQDNEQFVRRCRPKMTKEQKFKLLQLIKSSPEIKFGNRGAVYSKNSSEADLAVKRWKEIAEILNAMDKTAKKEWHVWRRSWSDIRTKLRKNWSKVVQNDTDSSIDQCLDEATSNTYDPEFKRLNDVTKIYCEDDDDDITSNTIEIQTLDETENSFSQPAKRNESINKIIKKNNKNVNNLTRKKEMYEIDEIFAESNNFHGFSKLESSTNKRNRIDSPQIVRIRTKPHSNEKRKRSSFRDSITSYLNRDAKVKEDYYTKKLRLVERNVIAHESIASSLRLLTEGRSDLF